jgi:hypothetical protein
LRRVKAAVEQEATTYGPKLIFDRKLNYMSPCLLVGNVAGAGCPEGSRALTLLAPTGERMAFYEAARQDDKKALQ